MGRPKQDLATRLWARVTKGDGCWEWQGCLDRYGYGRIRAHGRDTLSHRAAYEVAHGPIPNGMQVCHRCDNRRCVRPDHLFLGTHQDNVDDMVTKGRQAKGGDGYHGGHRGAALTEADVRLMLELYRSGATKPALAQRFGVDRTHVSAIVRGKRWRHIPRAS